MIELTEIYYISDSSQRVAVSRVRIRRARHTGRNRRQREHELLYECSYRIIERTNGCDNRCADVFPEVKPTAQLPSPVIHPPIIDVRYGDHTEPNESVEFILQYRVERPAPAFQDLTFLRVKPPHGSEYVRQIGKSVQASYVERSEPRVICRVENQNQPNMSWRG